MKRKKKAAITRQLFGWMRYDQINADAVEKQREDAPGSEPDQESDCPCGIEDHKLTSRKDKAEDHLSTRPSRSRSSAFCTHYSTLESLLNGLCNQTFCSLNFIHRLILYKNESTFRCRNMIHQIHPPHLAVREPRQSLEHFHFRWQVNSRCF